MEKASEKREADKSWRQAGSAGNRKKFRPEPLAAGPDVKGIIVTTSMNREGRAVQEMYDLLAEQYGENVITAHSSDQSKETAPEPTEECDDLDKALKQECEQLKDKAAAKDKMRFRALDVKPKHVFFMKCNHIDDKPSQIVHKILTDAKETGKAKSRFIQRLVPADFTFKPNDKGLSEACAKLADQCADDDFKTFAVIYTARLNNVVKREMVYDFVHNYLTSKKPELKVDLKHPDRAVLVEILKNVGCISIVSDYYQLAKFNLHLAAQPASNQTTDASHAAEISPKDDDRESDEEADDDGSKD